MVETRSAGGLSVAVKEKRSAEYYFAGVTLWFFVEVTMTLWFVVVVGKSGDRVD